MSACARRSPTARSQRSRARRNVEDVHGAIDARVRELAGATGEWLHAGRSRNDQVATTLLLYARDRAQRAAKTRARASPRADRRARRSGARGRHAAGGLHAPAAGAAGAAWPSCWRAWAEPFVRAAHALRRGRATRGASCPLGSAALAGSSCRSIAPRPRARSASRRRRATRSTRSATATPRSICAHAFVRAAVDASRIARRADRLVRAGVRLTCGSATRALDRFEPDAAEAQSRSVRTRARAHAARLIGSVRRRAGDALRARAVVPARPAGNQEPNRSRSSRTRCAALGGVRARVRRRVASRASGWRRDGARRVHRRDRYRRRADRARHDARAPRTRSSVRRSRARSRKGARLTRGDLARLAASAGIASLDAPLDARASVGAKRTPDRPSPDEVRAALAARAARAAGSRDARARIGRRRLCGGRSDSAAARASVRSRSACSKAAVTRASAPAITFRCCATTPYRFAEPGSVLRSASRGDVAIVGGSRRTSRATIVPQLLERGARVIDLSVHAIASPMPRQRTGLREWYRDAIARRASRGQSRLLSDGRAAGAPAAGRRSASRVRS